MGSYEFVLWWCDLISLISTQNIFHTSEFLGWFGSKLLNFGLMLNCFGPVRSGEYIIGSVRGRGHKIYYFSVRSGSGQNITGQYRFGVPKLLPRRTLTGPATQIIVAIKVGDLGIFVCTRAVVSYVGILFS